MLTVQISFTGEGRVLRVTPQTARWLFFQVFHLTPQNKLDLEMPKDLWRPCGGLIDHLHRRCAYKDLFHDELDLLPKELDWLERGLNLLLAKRRYKLFPNEERLEHVYKAPKHKGLYTQRCGAIFLLEPLAKDRLALENHLVILRQDLAWEHHFLRFVRVKSYQGKIWFELKNFFSGLDESMTIEDFQRQTQRALRVVEILPTEQSYLGHTYWYNKSDKIAEVLRTQITLRG